MFTLTIISLQHNNKTTLKMLSINNPKIKKATKSLSKVVLSELEEEFHSELIQGTAKERKSIKKDLAGLLDEILQYAMINPLSEIERRCAILIQEKITENLNH
jgi:hypothetical protein